jgi:glycolate oxidase
LAIDPVQRLVSVQPGVITAKLREAVNAQGLFYPPDPASMAASTIGGNIATDAGGLCCVKYGVTRNYVVSVTAVIGTGEVIQFGHNVAKDVMGYHLLGLMVGSEGTLGVITEATLRLLPAPKTELATIVGYFDGQSAMSGAIAALFEAGLDPTVLEFIDPVFMAAINAYHGRGELADIKGAANGQGDQNFSLICQIESDGSSDQKVAEIFRAAGAKAVKSASTLAEGERLLAERRTSHASLAALGTTVSEDISVPRSRLGLMLDKIADIAKRHDLLIGSVGHVGDGNLHPNILVPDDSQGEARAKLAFEEIMASALELEGSITGEHGVGLLKRDMMARGLGSTQIGLHQAIKQAFDPRGILNPGKVLA